MGARAGAGLGAAGGAAEEKVLVRRLNSPASGPW